MVKTEKFYHVHLVNIYYERLSLKITNKYYCKGLKYCKFTWKKNKVKQIMKKKSLQKVTTTYIEHKHKNAGTSVLIDPQNGENFYH